MSELTCVVSGSFGKYIDQVWAEVQLLEALGVEVLAPKFDSALNPDDEFVLLDTDDPDKTPYELEFDYLQNIARASIHLVVNPTAGRVGLSAAAEYAHAALNGTPSFATCIPKITCRDYPEIWFSNDLTADEQAVLERLPWRGLSRVVLHSSSWEQVRDSILYDVARTKPMPPDHPDFEILAGIPARLLDSLRNTTAPPPLPSA